MLRVSAAQLGHPVLLVVQMKARDGLIDRHGVHR